MINRVRRFLPALNPSDFKHRGRAGIRSLLVDRNGNFASETLIIENDSSLHILNYNSPGATGALSVAASLVKKLVQRNMVKLASTRINFPFMDEFE
jgi:L-2-hydroxyglutarate oxidase